MEKTINKKRMTGTVISDKMQKTVVVSVSRYVKNKKYGKFTEKHSRFKAHDEKGEYHTGDKVVIESTRPMSKDKHFIVVAKA